MTNDEAMRLARDLMPRNAGQSVLVTSADLRRLCHAILSGDMKREIENAAYGWAKKVVRALEKPEPEYDHCDDERTAYLLGYDDAVQSGCQEIDALITPAKTADTEG